MSRGPDHRPPAEGGEVLAAQLPLLPVLPERRHVAAYKGALLDFWRLMAAGPDVDPEEAARVRDEVVRHIDDVGEPLATELRQRWEIDWHRETGRCPRCGERGEQHV